jgi:hypothetical protein
MRSNNIIIKAVSEMSSGIWTLLQPTFVLSPTTQKWSKSVNDITNCVGAQDGKHFWVRYFSNSRSENCMYKIFFPLLLTVGSDADRYFTAIYMGGMG